MPPVISDIERILSEAVDIASPAERQAFVERSCGGNGDLQRQVEELIRNHFQAGAFLEQPAHYDLPRNITPAATDDLDEPELVPELLGTIIGPYKLREVLGEGGMGIVYVAEQEKPVRRKVALKVIKPGMDTREVISRFEAERQALALMDHPNIAKVLDAGTTGEARSAEFGMRGGATASVSKAGPVEIGSDGTSSTPNSALRTPHSSGRPYFVMELVRGIPITEYCDKACLSPRERLKLFVQVCQAIQHAHQKGVIHRDLKPSNVLVTLHDGVPVPKVIDFGVAKAINQRLSEHTIYTRMAQIVGTPMYMSPEQAELSALDVDTRSDVYSLGVLLYELLTGSTPFTKETLHQAGFDEMRRIIREVEPPRPSQRISTLDARARTTRSAKRGLDERQLKRHLEGELDWIVMKALEKDRQRRYESASSFAADIQRYLDDQPVEACPPSTFYRLRKFVRRNRANLTVAVVMSTTLVGGTGISLLVHNANLSKYNTELMRLNGDLKQATANAQSQQSKAEDNERRKGDALYAADVNRAARALGDNDALAAKLLLNRQVPDGGDSDRRGFEWWYLRGRIEHANRILLDVGSALYVLCPTPDGRLLAAAGQDATVRLFDPETGTIEREIATGQIEVNGVAFSPDGREMATAGDDGTIRIWRLETGTERIEFRAHPGKAFQLVYSHDGGSIISCGDDPIIRIFASDSGRQTEELRGHTKTVQTLLLASPEMLISGSDDETARRWFLDHSNEPFQIASDTKVSALSAAPGRNLLFTGNERNVVEAWSLRDGRKISQVKHLDSIRSLALHPAGELLAVGDRDGSIRLWKVGADAEIDSENVRVWQAHQGSTHGLSWAADGSRLVSVGDDGRAMSWSLSEMQSESPRRFKVDRSSSFCLIPGTTSLVTCGSKECALVRWNWHTGNEEGRFAAPILAYRPVRISPDGTQMAATCISHQLLHAQPVEWWFRAPIPGQQWGEWGYGGYVGAPRFSPDSRWIAVAFQADGASQKHVWLLGLPDFARSEQIPIPVAGAGEAAFSPDGRFLAIARITGLVLWDIAGSKALWESAEPHTGVVEFSPDGKYLFTGGSRRVVDVWNAADGSIRFRLAGHRDSVRTLAVAPDSKTLATVSADGVIKLWHVATGQELFELRGADSKCHHVEFTRDGQHLLALVFAGEDHDILVFDAPRE